MSTERETLDWPPQKSASSFSEGERRYGSTGQLFQVRDGQWVRLKGLRLASSRPPYTGSVVPFENLDVDSLFNIRQWVCEAVEAKGAKVTGAGICVDGGLGMADVDIEIDGCRFNLGITQRPRPVDR